MPVRRSQIPFAEHSTSGWALLAAIAVVAQAAPLVSAPRESSHSQTRGRRDEGNIRRLCVVVASANSLRKVPVLLLWNSSFWFRYQRGRFSARRKVSNSQEYGNVEPPVGMVSSSTEC